MSLPAPWIDRIFERLTALFGHEFLRRWDGMDMAAIKADWANELDGYSDKPESISYALDTVEAPPDVRQFRNMCRKAPDRAVAAFLDHKVYSDPTQVKKAVYEARQALQRTIPKNRNGHAEYLRDREINHGGMLETGQTMRQFHRDYWRSVLNNTLNIPPDSPQ